MSSLKNLQKLFSNEFFEMKDKHQKFEDYNSKEMSLKKKRLIEMRNKNRKKLSIVQNKQQ